MAFKGDLTNISLFDVFQTLSQNKQSGVLVLSREGHTKKIYISPDGVRIFFTKSFRQLRLGEIFVRRGVITSQDVEILLLEQKKEYRPFGELLVESEKVPQEDVDAILRYHAEDEIFEVFGWESGSFSFYDGQEAGDSSTPLSEILMDPAGLCLEAARRLDEMERVRESIPSNDEYYVQAAGLEPDREQNTPAVCALFDALAEPNSIDDLRDLVGLSLYDVLSAIYQLVEGKLIRQLTVMEMVNEARRARDLGITDRAARLLEKAHERQPGDRKILEECVEAIERLGDVRRLARYLASLGSICLEQGEVEEAIEYLEQAIRSDASHFGAMLSLRDAFLQQGDYERVAEMSLKIARVLAERGELREGLESCAIGLEHAPGAVALRLYYAQLLARTDHAEEAREQIWALVQDTERNRKAAQSERAHEVLASCYRLLLKLNPDDEQAEQGLRDLDRRRMSSLRRRKLAVRGGIAAALLAVVLGVGVTVGGQDAATLRDEIERAQGQRPNSTRVIELIDKLLSNHPDSDEARWALQLRKQIDSELSVENKVRKQAEEKIRTEMTQHLEEVRAALSDRPYVEALGPVKSFLDKLNQPQVGFLRKSMSDLIEFELISFLERVRKTFDQDRQQVAAGEVQVKQHEGNAEELGKLEDRLARVRQRDWLRLVPDLSANLTAICESPHVQKAKPAFHDLRSRMQGAQGIFSNLDGLFFTVRRERLRAEILDLVKLATTEGKDYLRICEFDRARDIYEAAYKKADSIIDEEPREHFRELLNWLEVRKIPAQMRAERDKIDHVVATLVDVENLQKAGKTDAAFKIMRDLVSDYRLIQFEKKYRMPFRVVSTPAGADVTVSGLPAGKTPCDISLEIGLKPMIVRVSRTGFEDAEARLVPTDPALDGILRAELKKAQAWDKEIIGGGIEAPPAITDGKLLLATTDASLVAFDLKDGTRLWEAATGLLHRVTARPVVSGRHAYLITADGHLHQVRLDNGEIVGRKDLGSQVDREPAVHDGVLYVATRKPSLVAVRGTTVLYEQRLTQSPTTRVIYLNGRLHVGTAKGAVLVHDALKGDEVTQYRVASGTSFWGGLTAHHHLILAGAEDGRLYAFDTKTGKQAWDFPTSGPLAAPAVSDGTHIYVPTRDGYVHVLDGGGNAKGRHDVGYAVRREPAILGGFLYVLGSNRTKAFDLAGQRLWWDRPFTDEFPQHVVSEDGHIVVITDRPWIYAFKDDTR